MMSWAIVAQICNPSYSGSRDQGDHSSKPALAKFCHTLSQKQPSQKSVDGVAQVVGPEFKLQYLKRKIQ
jgi:hypothetical protein